MSIERVTVTGQYYGGVTLQNVMHFLNPDGVQTPLQICQEIRDQWLTIMKPAWSNVIHMLDIGVYRVGSGVTPFHLAIDVQGTDGIATTGSLPFVCWKILIQTATAGRKGHGRIYISGLRQTHWTNGAIGSAGHTALDPIVTSLNNRYKSGGTGPITIGVFPRSSISSTDFSPATALSLGSVAGVQRRRNIGVGV